MREFHVPPPQLFKKKHFHTEKKSIKSLMVKTIKKKEPSSSDNEIIDWFEDGALTSKLINAWNSFTILKFEFEF